MAHWIHNGTPKSSRFECSECGNTVYYHIPVYKAEMGLHPGGKLTALPCPYPYCPYCRTKMEEEK